MADFDNIDPAEDGKEIDYEEVSRLRHQLLEELNGDYNGAQKETRCPADLTEKPSFKDKMEAIPDEDFFNFGGNDSRIYIKKMNVQNINVYINKR